MSNDPSCLGHPFLSGPVKDMLRQRESEKRKELASFFREFFDAHGTGGVDADALAYLTMKRFRIDFTFVPK